MIDYIFFLSICAALTPTLFINFLSDLLIYESWLKKGVLIVLNFKKGSQELVFFSRDAYISQDYLVDWTERNGPMVNCVVLTTPQTALTFFIIRYTQCWWFQGLFERENDSVHQRTTTSRCRGEWWEDVIYHQLRTWILDIIPPPGPRWIGEKIETDGN